MKLDPLFDNIGYYVGFPIYHRWKCFYKLDLFIVDICTTYTAHILKKKKLITWVRNGELSPSVCHLTLGVGLPVT